uniref:Uncharacterized protein n=1 Tax=Anguilla anguilla TaxID=7936 RepID=A0A0E9SFT8_ANGAN
MAMNRMMEVVKIVLFPEMFRTDNIRNNRHSPNRHNQPDK